MDKYIGKMLDNRYEILQVIGTGGMAVVYKARCHRLNRLVAVKILKDDYASDAEFRRRFHAESQAVAMLSHPNIVSVFDVSRSGDVEYIVMELIDGITLKQYVQKKGILNWREVLHFTTQIVKALEHAHSRGIIHRDIKPHNIMILRDGSIKVADFGIARFTAKQNTLTQEALGSVHYISPEQARGSHVDARSDIYSVGVVMYEMLTGRLPYEGDSPVSVAIQHINSMPLTPREINPEIPPALEAIVLKAMSSNINRRYTSAEEMYADLEEFRKNPNIDFNYNMKNEEVIDEPTVKMQIIPGRSTPAETVKRRQEELFPVTDQDKNKDSFPKRRRRPGGVSVAAGVAAVLIFIVGMVILFVSLIGEFNKPTSKDLIAPQLLYMDIDEARRFVRENEELQNLTIVEDEPVFNDKYPAGTIIEQNPSSGRTIKSTGEIHVVLSKGPLTIPMPDLTNIDYKTAQIQLINLGINVNPIVYEASDITQDFVIRTDPVKDTMVQAGQYVTLYVSSGAEIKQVPVPDLIGLTENAAIRLLQAANLLPGEVSQIQSDAPAGEVVNQSIAKDTMVDEKTKIDYVISLGPPSPPPSTEPTPSDDPSSSPQHGKKRKVTEWIKLPSSGGSTIVTIKLNNETIYDEIHQTSEGGFEFTFTIEGSSILAVYFDGVLSYEKTYNS